MPRTNNENLISGTQTERISVSLDAEQLVKDTTSQSLFVGDGSTVGGRAVDVRPVSDITGNYTLVRADEGKILRFNSASAITITIPTNANVGYPVSLTRIPFINLGAGVVTLVADTGVTLTSIEPNVDSKESGEIHKTATNTWFLTKGGSGASQLTELTDVNITNLLNTQTLQYNTTSGKWENVTSTDANTTYDLAVPASSTNLRLSGSDGSTDNVTLTGAGATSITRTSGTELTITSTNITYGVLIPTGTTSLRLLGSDASTDDISIVGGTNTTVTRTSDSILTLASDDTTYSLATSTAGSNAKIDLTAGGSGSGTDSITLAAGSNITISETGDTITFAGTAGTVTNVSGSSPISVSSGGTTPAISIAQSDATTNGFLSSSDWSTFQSRLSSVGITSGGGLSVSGSPLTTNGSITLTNTGVTSNVSGTGISVSGATGAVTISNTGVTSNVAGSGISVSGGTGAVTIANTGVTSAVASTGVSVSSGTGNVTFTNTDLGSSQNIFKTVVISGQDNIVADSNSDILTLAEGSNITLTTDAGTDTITIAGTDTTYSAGTGIGLTGTIFSNLDKGSAQNIFKTLAVAGQSDIVADSNTDTLTFIAGSNVSLTTNAGSDTLTIASTDTNYSAGSGLDLAGTTFSVDVSDFMANGVDNRILTASGADSINAESGLTYNGSTLNVGGSVIISSDLTVNGTTTTINTQTLSVDDPMVVVGDNNSANSVDLGIIGKYVDTNTYYSGLLRDASAGKFRLFTTTQDLSSATTVDPTNGGYANADLIVGSIQQSGATNGIVYADSNGNLLGGRTIAEGVGIDITNGSGVSGNPTIALDLSELTTSTSNADGDFFVVVDTGNAQKKLTKANINISGFNNDSGFTTNTGTVTSVGLAGDSGSTAITTSGTFTVAGGTGVTTSLSGSTVTINATGTDTTYSAGDGLDLSGTTFSTDLKSNGGLVIESTELAVDLGASSITGTLAISDGGTGATSAGSARTNLGLGSLATLSSVAFSNIAPAAIQLSSESFTDVDTTLMTSAAIQDKILSYGYTTNTGTTTASNTQTFTNKSGNISQWTNDSGYTTNTGTTTASNTQTFTNKSGVISQWTNDSGYTTNVGDITGVTAGQSLSGGGTSGSVSLGVADNGIGALQLNVSGNGSSGQALTSDGDGTFSWTTMEVGDITAVVAGTGLSGGGTSGSVTMNIDSTVATLTGTQTLTNKTISSPILSGGLIQTSYTSGQEQVLISASSILGALKVQQTGTGNSIEVHDEASDNTIFAVGTSGNTTIGYSGSISTSYKLLVAGNTGSDNFYALSDGTTTQNAFARSSDTNTGMYFPAVDTLGLVTGGGEKIRLSSSGVKILNPTNSTLGYTLPTSDGSANQVIQTNGSGTLSFATISASVGGSDTELLYNNGGTEDGIASLTWTDTAGSEQFKITDTSDTALVLIEQLGTGNAFEIHDSASDTSIFKVRSNGSIGIGLPSGTGFGYGKVYVQGIVRADEFGASTGSASGPTHTFEGDQNTGMYSGGTDILGFSTAGTERMTIAANGTVDVVGTLDTTNLTIAGTQGSDGQVLTSTGSGVQWESPASGGISWSTAVNANIIPDTDNTYDIGSATNEFRHGYFDGTVNCDGINIAGSMIAGNSSLYIIGGGSQESRANIFLPNNETNMKIQGSSTSNTDIILDTRYTSGTGQILLKTKGQTRFSVGASGEFKIGTAAGSSGQVLTSGGSGSIPTWTTISSSSGTVTSVTAGTGMTQSGTSTVNPTLNVIGGTGITANADDIEIDTSVVATLSGTQTFSGAKTFSAVAKISNGSLSAPALSFSSQANQGMYRISSGSTGFTSSGQLKLTVDPYGITVGDGNSAGYVNAKGTQDLILRTNNGTNSSQIKMVDGVNGDIDIDTNGTGSVKINYPTALNSYSLLVKGNGNHENPFHSAFHTTSTNQIWTAGHFAGLISSGSRTTGFGTQIEFRLGEVNYAGLVAGKIGAKMQDTGDSNFDMFITPQGTGNLALGNFTLDADQSVGSGQDNYVMTYNNSTGLISLEEAGGGASSIGELSDAVTTATSNIGLGSGALDSLTASSGNYNVALGVDAGTAISVGDGNCLIGFESGKAITNKSQNTLVGYQAGLTLNESQNTLVGYQAGKALVAHAQNTFIGAGTGVGATSDQAVSVGYGSMFQYSGTGGIAIGYQAGLALTSADYPIFIGYKAGWSASTGARNIGVGYQALKSVGSSSDNIAIGYDALSGVISSGNYNVAIGSYTLDSLTSADRSIAIGYQSGTAVTTGGDHVMIGHTAGAAITNQSTGVFVGYRAGFGSTGYSETIIGSQAGTYGTGYNTVVGHNAMNAGTGSANTFIGWNAGQGVASNSASQNVGIGADSLKDLTTGSYNLGVGRSAGQNITTGQKNIILSSYNGASSLTTGAYNVLIGNADVSSASVSQSLTISDGSGTIKWIEGDSSGAVNLPNSKLKVNGSQGSDGQVLTSTGSGIAWEDAGGGGATYNALEFKNGGHSTSTSNTFLPIMPTCGTNSFSANNPFYHAQKIYMIPLWSASGGTLNRIKLHATTDLPVADTDDWKIAIYESGEDGYPKTLLTTPYQWTPTSAWGTTMASIYATNGSSQITLDANKWYWLAYLGASSTSGDNVSMGVIGAERCTPLSYAGTINFNNTIYWNAASTSFPSTLTVSSGTNRFQASQLNYLPRVAYDYVVDGSTGNWA